MSNDHKEHRERVRQRFLREMDFGSFHPHEVLEMLLFYCIPVKDTKPLAKELLRQFGSLSGVLEATPEELTAVNGVGRNTAVFMAMLTPLYRYYYRDRWKERPDLSKPSNAVSFCTSYFIGKRYEELIMVCMTGGYQVLHVATIATGTINEITVYARIVMETALRHNAKTVVLAHNHPGGSEYASPNDVSLTHLARAILSDVDIDLLDHYVVIGERAISINRQVRESELNKLIEEVENRIDEPSELQDAKKAAKKKANRSAGRKMIPNGNRNAELSKSAEPSQTKRKKVEEEYEDEWADQWPFREDSEET